ncbi:MAG: tetratricopeptide repeat protein [Nodosilinea sp. LVE1205-7]|jgi:tetratricopeptide (TPR) repeat protein
MQQWGGLILKAVLVLICSLMGWLGAAGFNPVVAAEFAVEPVPATLEMIQDLRQQAFAATQAGQFATADQYWSQLLDYLPQEPALWSNRGNVRVSLNHLEAALADYDRAITLAPYQPDAYLNRGAVLEGLGQWSAAIADYNRLLDLTPDDAAAYNNRGNAQGGQGDWTAALADYEKAVALNPKFALARINVGLAQYQLGEEAMAIAQFRNLTRRYPNFADARAALTAALWNGGQPGEAESNWVAVMGLDGRYRDLNWVRQGRRWPPRLVRALERFLYLQAGPHD